MKKSLELFIESFDSSVPEKQKIENKYYVAYSIKDQEVVYTEIGSDIPDNELWYWTTDSNPITELQSSDNYEILPYTDKGIVRFSAPIKTLSVAYQMTTMGGSYESYLLNPEDARRITCFQFPKTLSYLSLSNYTFDNLQTLIFHKDSKVLVSQIYPTSLQNIENADSVSIDYSRDWRPSSLVGSKWYNQQEGGPVYLNSHTLIGFKGIPNKETVIISNNITYIGSFWTEGEFEKVVWDIPHYCDFVGSWQASGGSIVNSYSVFQQSSFDLDPYVFYRQELATINNFEFGSSVERIPAYLFGQIFSYYTNGNGEEYITESFVTIPNVVIGSNVSSIGEGGIGHVDTLTCYAANPPEITRDIQDAEYRPFGIINQIYVPEESVEAYKTAEGWNFYADRIYPIAA